MSLQNWVRSLLTTPSLGLVNACLRSAVGENCKQYPELVTILEKLGIRRYVSVWLPSHSSSKA